MKINKPFNIQLSPRWKKLFGLTSTSSEEQVPIGEYYGIGGRSYGEEEFGHFLI
jgi:hypothetical protein